MLKVMYLDDVHYPAMGTSLQGRVDISYKELVEVFGQPNAGDGYKTEAEWIIMTRYGAATIYDYKEGKTYNGKDGLNKTEITDWHIGGSNQETVKEVLRALGREV